MAPIVDEKELLAAISSGDIESFEKIFFMYQPRLIYFLKGFVHNTEVSKDMAQDIFLLLWKDRYKLCQINSFSSYLFTIARFRIYNYFDRLATENKYTTDQLLKTDIADSEEEKIFARELQSLINSIVSKMPSQQQRVYKMSREEHLSNEIIAEQLGISKRTVENYITTALAVLRKTIYLTIMTLSLP